MVKARSRMIAPPTRYLPHDAEIGHVLVHAFPSRTPKDLSKHLIKRRTIQSIEDMGSSKQARDATYIDCCCVHT